MKSRLYIAILTSMVVLLAAITTQSQAAKPTGKLTVKTASKANAAAAKQKKQTTQPSPEISSKNDKIVKNVRASAQVPIANISPEQARKKALEQAKNTALTETVGEEISVGTAILQSDRGNTFAQMSSIQSRGAIVNIKIITDRPQSIENQLCYEIEILCDIKIYDPETAISTLNLDVQGVKPAYNSGEQLRFSVSISDSAYVYIFLLDQNGAATKVIPSGDVPYLQPPHKTVYFPLNPAIQYTLYLENPFAPQEDNQLVVVAFDKPQYITAQDLTSFETLSCWIYNIQPNMRSIPQIMPIRIFE